MQHSLDVLCADLIEPEALSPCHPVDPADIPDPCRKLLVHHDHMTATLVAHYKRPIMLHVHAKHLADGHYARLITLTPDNEARVVEIGLVRIHLDSTPPAVRDMILQENTPLGDILIRKNVLRRIEPLTYLCFQPGTLLSTHFGPVIRRAYGRIGVIHCDARPAIRLLEIIPEH